MSTPAIAIAGAALYAVSATFWTCDGLVCLPVRLSFRGRRCVCGEFTALPHSCRARRMIAGNRPVPRPPFTGLAAVIKLAIVSALSISLIPITATRHWPLTPDTTRLIGTFKNAALRN
jgi:hypothetical protein